MKSSNTLVRPWMACLFVLVIASTANAFPGYAPFVATDLGCATCHVNPSGGGVRNLFGQQFQSFPFFSRGWSNLCGLDADNDSFTNGEELGDPDCAWAIGQPKPTSVSDPSDPNSFPETLEDEIDAEGLTDGDDQDESDIGDDEGDFNDQLEDETTDSDVTSEDADLVDEDDDDFEEEDDTPSDAQTPVTPINFDGGGDGGEPEAATAPPATATTPPAAQTAPPTTTTPTMQPPEAVGAVPVTEPADSAVDAMATAPRTIQLSDNVYWGSETSEESGGCSAAPTTPMSLAWVFLVAPLLVSRRRRR